VGNGYFSDHVRTFTGRSAFRTLFSTVRHQSFASTNWMPCFICSPIPAARSTTSQASGALAYDSVGFPRATCQSNRDDRFRYSFCVVNAANCRRFKNCPTSALSSEHVAPNSRYRTLSPLPFVGIIDLKDLARMSLKDRCFLTFALLCSTILRMIFSKYGYQRHTYLRRITVHNYDFNLPVIPATIPLARASHSPPAKFPSSSSESPSAASTNRSSCVHDFHQAPIAM
jgi:hypothetical protein